MARPRKSDLMNLPAGGNVTMHNTLVSASHGLNLGEKRLVAMAVAKLSPKAAALPGKPIRISAMDFAEQFGIEPDVAYKQLRSAQEHLYNRSIRHIEHYGPNGQKIEVVKMRWISSIRYKEGEGEVSIAFAPEITQFLVQLKKHFTSYQLSKAAALRSTYSWRLFVFIRRGPPDGFGASVISPTLCATLCSNPRLKSCPRQTAFADGTGTTRTRSALSRKASAAIAR